MAPWTYAQRILSGRFTDKDARPLPYLEVIATRGDSILAGTLTDSSGVFKLELPSGAYHLKAMLLHDELYERRIVLTRSRDLGTLSVEGLQLGEVAVDAQKKLVEQKVDRLVFNLGNSITASGGDILDALRITPGLQLRDDGIALIGKGVMRVMVDGRLLPL